jgi:hypothetical protein
MSMWVDPVAVRLDEADRLLIAAVTQGVSIHDEGLRPATPSVCARFLTRYGTEGLDRFHSERASNVVPFPAGDAA